MRKRVVKKLRPFARGLLKGVAAALSVVLVYRALLFTMPVLSKQLRAVTMVSAGLSFIDGGVALAEQEIKGFQEDDSELYTSHATQEDELSDTLTSSEDTSSEPVSSEPEPAPESIDPNEVYEEATDIPERIENSGDIVRKTMTPGTTEQFVALTSGYIKNLSALSNQEVLDLSNAGLPFTFEDTDEPQVLIYHTHATESYQDYYTDWYDLSYNARDTDNSKNMVAVGDVLEQKLKAAGIGVIHDGTQHDNPSYTGAYDRSRVTIQHYLDQYPSIKVVLDVHRDAIQGDNVITAPATEINGVKCAQIMMISCCDDGTNRIPNYRQNLSFAATLQKQMETDYPTLTRPILFDDRFYNQDMSNGAVLIEVGDHGNTLNEAKNAISLLGNSLIKVLKG